MDQPPWMHDSRSLMSSTKALANRWISVDFLFFQYQFYVRELSEFMLWITFLQVFLISTRAGSLGVNLVSANRVVIFDPSWNPAQDLQAQDRSFRYGQKRHVTVFRLLGAGSLEELIYSRQIYKQQLSNIAVSGTIEKRYFNGVQVIPQSFQNFDNIRWRMWCTVLVYLGIYSCGQVNDKRWCGLGLFGPFS
jgi:hypothetical protein